MATTTLILLQSFFPLSSPNLLRSLTPFPLRSPLHLSAFLKKNKAKRRIHLPISSSSGPRSELTEDAKFVPLNAEDPIYGPPVLLLLGFEANETDKIKELLRKIDGYSLYRGHAYRFSLGCNSHWTQVRCFGGPALTQSGCFRALINEAPYHFVLDVRVKRKYGPCSTSYTQDPNTLPTRMRATTTLLNISNSLPRICFLSGLTGEEMMMFIDAFPETGLEPAVFAAVVPNSANKILGDVVEEIMGDHEMMSSQSRS